MCEFEVILNQLLERIGFGDIFVFIAERESTCIWAKHGFNFKFLLVGFDGINGTFYNESTMEARNGTLYLTGYSV